MPTTPASRRREIWALSLPIIGGMTSQNVLNLVDMAMVGQLGSSALAGVGLASFINFMAMALVTGLSASVQAIAARRIGEGRPEQAAAPLNGGLILAVLIGLPISLLLIALAPWLFSVLNPDPAVAAQGVPYLQMRLLSVVALGMNFCFRGYWSAVKLTRLYMRNLIWMHSLNIALNYCLIFGKLGLPALGTTGAGLGTSISLVIGTATYFWLARRHAAGSGFLQRRPSREECLSLVRLGLPNAVQQLLFATGFVVLFWIVGRIGTAELAVANVLVNITLVTVLPGMGFGIAAATLCGQALGRGAIDDAQRWAWEVFRQAVWLLAPLAAAMLLLPGLILSAFVTDPALVALGRVPLQLVGATVLVDALGLILMNALLGVGAAKLVMLVAVGLQWGLFLPLAWLLGPELGLGLNAVWLAMLAYRGVQTGLFTRAWRRRGWAGIRV
ncbi:MATE family efflux transporter [Stagnimonas aquatica]|uniref:Multidrug-efflux transporter n=1 Tax=Stagnimonas aquatica TaxID=2689987 RepID=A0A3N0VLA1_9GAMM|nr:MATE family efflux transporter [Stagnimonas aquatica]ROH93481.1 MATE family efflux transporter [Stagnimonas aquatica]